MTILNNNAVPVTNFSRDIQSIAWPLLVLVLLIWLESKNSKRTTGFMGGF